MEAVMGMLLLLAIGCLLAGTALTGFIAGERGRSVVGWMFIALLCTPLLALVALAAAPRKSPLAELAGRRREADAARARGRVP